MSLQGELRKRLKLSHNPTNRWLHQRPASDFAPECWEDYFDDCFYIKSAAGKFRTYSAGSKDTSTIVICLHGGGFSSLSWGFFAKMLVQKICVTLYAIDLRGHGETFVLEEQNLSIENLVEDMTCCIEQILTLNKDTPKINLILIGHSLGGAIGTCIAAPPSRLSDVVKGLVVIDVVEGSAIASLSHMTNVLQSRPTGFETLKDAIIWSASRSQGEDFTALRVSMPGQLKFTKTQKPGSMYVKAERELLSNLQNSEMNLTGLSLSPSGDELTRKMGPRSAFRSITLSGGGNNKMKVNGSVTSGRSKKQAENSVASSNSKTHVDSSMTSTGSCMQVDDSTPPTGMFCPGSNGSVWTLQENRVEGSGSRFASPIKPRGMFRPKALAPRRQQPPLSAIPQQGALSLSRSPLHRPGTERDNFTWRVNLHASQTYWSAWFNGMSAKFLESPAVKLLVLCGEDRLDTTLHRGQMQGKFQMNILRSGHQVQEDKPAELSDLIANFLIRHMLCPGNQSNGITKSPLGLIGGPGCFNNSVSRNLYSV